MVIISGYATIHPDRIEEAKAISAAVVAETAKEAGCITYRFYQDLEIPNRFLAYEEWESEEAIVAHFQTPHVQAFFAALPALLIEPPVIKKHLVASSSLL